MTKKNQLSEVAIKPKSNTHNFKAKINKYKTELKVKKNIDKAWKGLVDKSTTDATEKTFANPFLNSNIVINPKRSEHKKNLTHIYNCILSNSYLNSSNDAKRNQPVFNQLNLFKNDQINYYKTSDKKLINLNEAN